MGVVFVSLPLRYLDKLQMDARIAIQPRCYRGVGEREREGEREIFSMCHFEEERHLVKEIRSVV